MLKSLDEVSGKTTLWGMQHTLTAGLEFSWERSLCEGYLVSDSAFEMLTKGAASPVVQGGEG